MASNKSKIVHRKANGRSKPGRRAKPKIKANRSKIKKIKAKSRAKKIVRAKVRPKVKAPKSAGKITHYFSNISVAIVKFSKNMPVGAELRFKGATTDFRQKLSEMQYNHQPIKIAKKGKEVGVKVNDRVREGDQVFEEKQ